MSTIMFYYHTNHLHFNDSTIGVTHVIGWGGLVLIMFLLNHYFGASPIITNIVVSAIPTMLIEECHLQ